MLGLSTLIVIVLVSIIKKDNEWKKWVNRIGLLIIVYLLLINLSINKIEYLYSGYNIYNNLLYLNNININMINIILLISILYTMIISFNITTMKKLDNIIIIKEWLMVLILFNIMGLILLILVNDLMMLFVIIELQSYSLYLITSVYNESSNSIKSGLYYFIVGSIGSFIILDGTVSIYEDIGLTNIEYILLYIENINLYDILIILFGLFIKIGLAPFYNYSIIIYTMVPTIITNYISLMPKLSILTLILNFVNILNITHNNINNNILNIICLLILISMLIGSLGGLNVIKIKTLLAYSSLLNVSYMLLAIISNNNYSLIAYIFYILQYSLTHINIFSILLLLPLYCNINLLINNSEKITGEGINKNIINIDNNYNLDTSDKSDIINNKYYVMISKYSPVEYISQLKNLFSKNIFICMSLCISLFSLIGIPPLTGFYGKLLILTSSLSNGYIFLSIILVIVSSISAVYYGNVIKELSFDILNNYNLFKNKILLSLNNISGDSSFENIKSKDLLYYTNNNNNVIYINNNISYLISILTLIIILIVLEYDNIIKGIYLIILN